jgi:hypothetical protein
MDGGSTVDATPNAGAVRATGQGWGSGERAMAGRSERSVATEQESLPADENLLLLAPSIGSAERRACANLLGRHSLDITNALHVLYVESPAERYETVEAHLPHHPAETAVLTVGTGGLVEERGPAPKHTDYFVETVPDPADLTGLGMALEDCLAAWHGDGYDVGVCFDSVSVLLQYAETDRAYRFLHSLTDRLAAVGAAGHFHLDPAAHDERTVARLSSLFDSVVEVTGDHTVGP